MCGEDACTAGLLRDVSCEARVPGSPAAVDLGDCRRGTGSIVAGRCRALRQDAMAVDPA